MIERSAPGAVLADLRPQDSGGNDLCPHVIDNIRLYQGNVDGLQSDPAPVSAPALSGPLRSLLHWRAFSSTSKSACRWV